MPTALLFAFKLFFRGFILLLIALMIFIPLSVVVFFLAIYSRRYAVIKNNKFVESAKKSFKLFTGNLIPNILMGIIVSLIGFLATLAFAFITITIAIPFIFLGFASYLIAKGIGVALVVTLGVLLFIVAVAFFNAIMSTFQSTVWTLTFRALEGQK
jgi:hypothetical protein